MEHPNTTFYIGRASFEGKGASAHIRFSNGRHRTRWLLDKGTKTSVIPLALRGNILAAQETGLILKEIVIDELIDLKTTIKAIKTEEAEWNGGY